MKKGSTRAGNVSPAWSDIAYAALQGSFVDTFDDRVGDDLVDRDDERDAVDRVVNEMKRSLN